MLSVVTWKWKSATPYRSQFGPETVNILKECVKRNYHKPHRFICVTDDPKGIDSDIKVIRLWNEFADLPSPFGVGNPSCYRRLRMFGPEAKRMFGNRFVSLDLDCVVTGDLSPLWDRPEDIVLWGDTNPGTFYNGSMMLMTAGCRPQVWDDFHPEKSPKLAKAAGQFGSDQAWISYKLGPDEKKWTVNDGIYSYRIHLRTRQGRFLPKEARIVMFHGGLDPWSPQALSLNWVKDNWRYNPMSKEGIEAVNMDRGIVLLSNGKYIKIIQMFDEEGDETEDINEAVAFVAGHQMRVWSDLFSHFRKIRTN